MRRPPVKTLILIDADGSMVARMFDAERRHLGDIDASSEEVAVMTRGISPTQTAQRPEWDDALAGDGLAQRRAALVYALDV